MKNKKVQLILIKGTHREKEKERRSKEIGKQQLAKALLCSKTINKPLARTV